MYAHIHFQTEDRTKNARGPVRTICDIHAAKTASFVTGMLVHLHRHGRSHTLHVLHPDSSSPIMMRKQKTDNEPNKTKNKKYKTKNRMSCKK